MTQEFKNMLHIFGCGARGTKVNIENCNNLSRIRKMALNQECWDIVYCALREDIEKGNIKIPPEIAAQLEKTFVQNIARNIQRVEFNKNIIKGLQNEGVESCTLKGTTVARLYNMPEARISSDTDIIINPKLENKAIAFLERNGYTIKPYDKYDHHIKATHKIGGLLEVHVAYHSVHTKDMLLDGEIEYNEEYRTLDDGTVTQGINDGLLYLTFHIVKHFINDCMGIRQIMDLLLYMKEYRSQIDWDRYNALLIKLKYDKFISVIKGIGVKYWGFRFDDATDSDEEMNAILDEIELGGLFGTNEENREVFYHRYTALRNKKNKLAYMIKKYTKGESNFIKLLFPSLKNVSKYCPYVLKMPYLLPVAWMHRFIIKAKGIISGKGQYVLLDTDKTEGMIERRMEIIRKLDML